MRERQAGANLHMGVLHAALVCCAAFWIIFRCGRPRGGPQPLGSWLVLWQAWVCEARHLQGPCLAVPSMSLLMRMRRTAAGVGCRGDLDQLVMEICLMFSHEVAAHRHAAQPCFRQNAAA